MRSRFCYGLDFVSVTSRCYLCHWFQLTTYGGHSSLLSMKLSAVLQNLCVHHMTCCLATGSIVPSKMDAKHVKRSDILACVLLKFCLPVFSCNKQIQGKVVQARTACGKG